MPYIDVRRRVEIDKGSFPRTEGELNYALSDVIKKYVWAEGLSYAKINDVLGALEGAKLEFYRRVAVPYENGKIEANGDIYS